MKDPLQAEREREKQKAKTHKKKKKRRGVKTECRQKVKRIKRKKSPANHAPVVLYKICIFLLESDNRLQLLVLDAVVGADCAHSRRQGRRLMSSGMSAVTLLPLLLLAVSEL
jgi:hypothetical protein